MSSGWPPDYKDAVFLARACEEVGAAMFGPEWTGEEFRALPAEASDEEIARRDAVAERIVQAAEAGELPTANFDEGTGTLLPLPLAWWRGDRIRERFNHWKVDVEAPFDRLVPRSRTASWLYVHRGALDRIIRDMPFNRLTTALGDLQARAKALAERLMEQRYWTLIPALLWIGLRDISEAAEFLEFWSRTPELESGVTIEMVRLCVKGAAPGGLGANSEMPDEALLSALQNDELTATGLFRGEERRDAIRSLDWRDLKLVTSPTIFADGGAALFGPTHVHGLGRLPATFWTGLQFERELLMQRFPPTAAEDYDERLARNLQALAPPQPAWAFRPGEQKGLWATRKEVVEEAERRRAANGDGNSEKALCRALAEMASDLGVQWASANIESARRTSARNSRPDA